jgi:hypothetical protein
MHLPLSDRGRKDMRRGVYSASTQMYVNPRYRATVMASWIVRGSSSMSNELMSFSLVELRRMNVCAVPHT